jgi:hypothetical protein
MHRITRLRLRLTTRSRLIRVVGANSRTIKAAAGSTSAANLSTQVKTARGNYREPFLLEMFSFAPYPYFTPNSCSKNA